MEWLESSLSQDAMTLLLSIMIMVGFFLIAVYRVHVNHLKRMKKIDKTFNFTDKFMR